MNVVTLSILLQAMYTRVNETAKYLAKKNLTSAVNYLLHSILKDLISMFMIFEVTLIEINKEKKLLARIKIRKAKLLINLEDL